MAAKIKLLSENMVHKIAAGEVIERPASIVKELVENSIDAQAKRIVVEIKGGGKQYIAVSDDGYGMSPEDAQLSIMRHATSKMTSPSDLFNISTLGFRGEALASIGAISRMTIETRREEDAQGTRIVVEGGVVRECISMGKAPGTAITVRNMFFNTPARRKFLRQNETEARHVVQAMVDLAAAYPEISFELMHQDRQLLSCLPTTRKERAADLLGMGADALLEVDHVEAGIKIEGIICDPGECSSKKGRQFLIVRGRPIVDRRIARAIYAGYGGLLPENRHPSFLCWIDIDPKRIDVNVHPTKREIRLDDEKAVESVVRAAVKRSLEITETPSFLYRREGDGEFQVSGVNESQATLLDDARSMKLTGYWGDVEEASMKTAEEDTRIGDDRDSKVEVREQNQSTLDLMSNPAREAEVQSPKDADDNSRDAERRLNNRRRVWQFHRKYILSQIEDGIILVDQRAAHERILYEEALGKIDKQPGASQQLLFPLTLTLNPTEQKVVDEISELLMALGFGLREFGAGTIIIDAIPAAMRKWSEGEILYRIIEDYIDEKDEPGRELKQAVAMAWAKRNAMSSGDALSDEEMLNLLERLFKTEEPHICPHGHPAVVRIRLQDIDRMFGR